MLTDVLYGVVQAGGRLDVAGVICVAVECGLFLLVLRGLGDLRWRESLGGLLRIAAAGALAAEALLASGLGWQPVSMAPLPALLAGGAIGLAAIALFAAAQLALWWASGRPEGPEQRVLGLAAGVLASSRSRKQRRPQPA